MIYLVGDWHFFHNREFIYKARGFETVEEMNQTIIKNHNSIVKPEDDVYVLGDLLLGGPDNQAAGLELIAQMNGKLHLVRGNHDTDNRWTAYSTLENIIEQQNAIYLDYNKYHFYLSHYPSITSNNDYEKPLKARLLNLCGHSHTQDKWMDADKGYIYHCELDCHDNKPVLLDDIISEFKQKMQEDSPES